MGENMKKIGMGMNIRMALMMSFCLSLIGTLTSGHFTIPGFIISFLISTVISLLIGFIVPIPKANAAMGRKFHLQQGTIKARLAESLVSNLIYTPLMTFVMVLFAYLMTMKQSGGMAELSFGPMFLKSLIICFIAGYVLIFIFQPLFLKSLLKKYS